MKVGELRKQGWTAIQGDVLTNGLSDMIFLSESGAMAVNEGCHDELEIVDLLWRNKTSEEHGFLGVADYSIDGWRPYLGLPSSAYEPKVSIDEKPVFTQAMADAGELPPVGSFVLCNSDRTGYPENLNLEEHCVVDCWERDSVLEVIAHTEIRGGILPVVKFEDQVSTIVLKYIKPLYTCTPKKKAVDGAIAEWPLLDKATLEYAYDLWAHKIEQ